MLQTTNSKETAKAGVVRKSPDLDGSCRFESGPGHQKVVLHFASDLIAILGDELRATNAGDGAIADLETVRAKPDEARALLGPATLHYV